MKKYTELYVKTKASASGYSAISDDYKNMIKDETTTFENLSKDAADRFNSGTLADAKKKLADAKKEYADKKLRQSNSLQMLRKKLDDGQKEFDEKIAAAEKEIKENEQKLKTARRNLSPLKNLRETNCRRRKKTQERRSRA